MLETQIIKLEANVYLGNLSVEQIEERLGIELTVDERKELASARQCEAENIAPNKWHCFCFPFMIVCGSKKCAENVVKILTPYVGKLKEEITIIIRPTPLG